MKTQTHSETSHRSGSEWYHQVPNTLGTISDALGEVRNLTPPRTGMTPPSEALRLAARQPDAVNWRGAAGIPAITGTDATAYCWTAAVARERDQHVIEIYAKLNRIQTNIDSALDDQAARSPLALAMDSHRGYRALDSSGGRSRYA